jgi:hypothetical protein
MDTMTDEPFPKSLKSRRRSTARAIKAERVQEVLEYARANPSLEKRELRTWIQDRFKVGKGESYSYIRAAAKAAAETHRQQTPSSDNRIGPNSRTTELSCEANRPFRKCL